MNQGGEPAHDDYGLPRVDVQIPDDARELYRDVQAYHRELRALRRHERSSRWRAPLRRSGMVVPLIAGCLVLAMVAGMVLTMFSASPSFSRLAGQRPAGPPRNTGSAAGRASASSAAPSATAPSAKRNASGGPSILAAAPLPDDVIKVAGKQVRLSGLTGKAMAMAMVPATCRGCEALIKRLLAQAASAGVTVYLVGRRGSLAELNDLASASAWRSAERRAIVAIDTDSALNSAYQPDGLVVLLVDAGGSVRIAPALNPGFQLSSVLFAMRHAP